MRLTLGTDLDTSDRWARMMLAVLEDLAAKGGEVSRRAFLEIGQSHGYSNRGMASYYQVLVARAPKGQIRLTEAGRERLRAPSETVCDLEAEPALEERNPQRRRDLYRGHGR